MEFTHTQIILNLGLGLFVGCYGTLVGAGGGFMLVPMFLLGYGLPHEVAVGTSLVVVAANAFSGAGTYVLQKRVDYRSGVTFALATFPGAVIGAFLVQVVSGPIFNRGFGIFLFCLAFYLLAKKPPTSHPEVRGGWGWVTREWKGSGHATRFSYFEPLGVALSSVVGLVSSLLGIGGGIIHVPAMTELLRFPVPLAIATSHFILAWTALAGVVAHATQGDISWSLAFNVGVGAVLGAQLGAQLAKRVHASWLLKGLAIALLAVAVRLVLG